MKIWHLTDTFQACLWPARVKPPTTRWKQHLKTQDYSGNIRRPASMPIPTRRWIWSPKNDLLWGRYQMGYSITMFEKLSCHPQQAAKMCGNGCCAAAAASDLTSCNWYRHRNISPGKCSFAARKCLNEMLASCMPFSSTSRTQAMPQQWCSGPCKHIRQALTRM